MDKNYNLEQRKLMLPEYGRHIQKMVDYLLSIKDRDLRTSQARIVIEVMGNINPVLRDAADFKHKLWDHLFIMSGFQLDVESPYPVPTSEILNPRPDKMEYPHAKIARRHYGKNIENILAAIKNDKDEQGKTIVAGNLAKYMRAKSYEYNQEHPNNEVICKDIRQMSDNLITIDEVALNNLRNDYKQPHNNNRQRKNFSQNGSKNLKQGGKYRLSKNQHK